MKRTLSLEKKSRRDLPEEFRNEDIRFPESLVEHFLLAWTREGDTVFDPFAGFGTALIVAEEMGRVAYGIELDLGRAEYVKSLLRNPENLIVGDSRRLQEYGLPPFDLAITSPPYPFGGKNADDDPLSSYRVRGGGYESYISSLAAIFGGMKELMKPDARIVVEAGSIRRLDGIVTLAWDIARALSEVLRFEEEVTVRYDRGDFGFDHTYCLVFTS